ncbi:MAG: hypothetical protein CEO22_217 [Candidatus Berkelbacteria bacterium Gr01-1014_85]|uniref:YdhG-like domain-containing protein n=1 Tax=Candidatus Berkelbacteria bacterium Gr01-1014_85 TaxID=2017150 RepID=A0A554JCU3_9BACT|nr:MAG: hypothetical protein CEO22_217 [Candidatus Berkelbacteria bacterium Gr01-1014_85]
MSSTKSNAPKTLPSSASVTEYLSQLPIEKQQECEALIRIAKQVCDWPPVLWGDRIIGFGQYSYQYASGRSGIWPAFGFAPAGKRLTIYITNGFEGTLELNKQLVGASFGKSCLYLKELGDQNLSIVKELFRQAMEYRQKHDQAS